jgi:hypothetical protein
MEEADATRGRETGDGGRVLESDRERRVREGDGGCARGRGEKEARVATLRLRDEKGRSGGGERGNRDSERRCWEGLRGRSDRVRF